MIRSDVDDMIAFLDSLAKLDPVAMGRLIVTRVPCNDSLGKHTTVQTGTDSSNNYEVGLLGIINGYVGVIEEGERKGWGMVAAVIDADGRCEGFVRTDSQPVPSPICVHKRSE